MPVQTTRTLLEQINEALKGKIVYWLDNEKTHYGRILQVDKRGFVVVTKNGLPNQNTKLAEVDQPIVILDLDQAMLGILEISSLN